MAYGIILLLVLLLIGQKIHSRRQLRKLNQDLDNLLRLGTPLPIDRYQEGELSILASQMEKITIRLTEAADRVQKEKEYLADSLADISHQLRTPLTAMNLAVTLLRGPELEAHRRLELTAELRRQLSRIDWLVETLLKISKLDAGTVELASEPISVRELVEKAAEPVSIPMDLRNQSLLVSCQGEQLHGDFNWTAEALGNLLKNCMEHTPEGGTISVTAEETPLYTQIQVEDTGGGFSPEDLPHIFDRFYQGKNASPGTFGIGLSLARCIIANQNGTIQASNGDTGARFTIKFYKQVI